VPVPLALVSDIHGNDAALAAIVTGGSVEFRKTPWQSAP
jgi:hypothetical protein